MRKEEKSAIVGHISDTIAKYSHFYLTDIDSLDALQTSNLRRSCFKNEIELVVVKNTLLKRALEESDIDYSELYPTLKGNTSVMFCNVGNAPAKLIKSMRSKKMEKPFLKSAFVSESVYLGDEQLEFLSAIKSKDELLGDIISLLQSPAKNVISALQSGNGIIHGLLETIGEKNN